MSKNPQKPIENAGEIIERFGGIRPMSGKIDVPVTTIQGWKKRGVIPASRRDLIMQAAQENGIDLSAFLDTLADAPPANENGQETENQSGSPDLSAIPPGDAVADTEDGESDEESDEGGSAGPSVEQSRPAAEKPRDEYKSHDALMAEVRSNNENAVKTGVWAMTVLLLLALGGGLLLMIPGAQQANENAQKHRHAGR